MRVLRRQVARMRELLKASAATTVRGRGSLSLIERFIEVEGARIRCLDEGQGERTVLLWPGLGGTAEAFSRLLRDGAARDYRMVALDPPGHGRSDRMPLRGGAGAAAIFEAARDAVSAARAVIGGHSYGAVAALAALGASQDLLRRTAGLVLYDGGYLSADDDGHAQCERQIAGFTFATWDEYLAAVRAEARRWDDDMEEGARAMMVEREGRIRLRIDVASCEDAMRLIAAHAPGLLPRIEVAPAVLLRAGSPAEMETERGEGVAALRAKVPALEVRRVADASHELLDEAPGPVAEETWAFLERADWR